MNQANMIQWATLKVGVAERQIGGMAENYPNPKGWNGQKLPQILTHPT